MIKVKSNTIDDKEFNQYAAQVARKVVRGISIRHAIAQVCWGIEFVGNDRCELEQIAIELITG